MCVCVCVCFVICDESSCGQNGNTLSEKKSRKIKSRKTEEDKKSNRSNKNSSPGRDEQQEAYC